MDHKSGREGPAGRRGERGATLVEYALILALMVVASVPAIQYLTDSSEDEVANQADCVSTRPPPESCQLRAIPPDPPQGGPGAGAPGGGGDDDEHFPCVGDDCPPAEDENATASMQVEVVEGDPSWGVSSAVELAVVVENEEGDPEVIPLAGATVSFRYRILDPPTPLPFFGSCTTDANGLCSHDFEVPEGALEVEVSIISIASDPLVPLENQPPPQVVGAP